MDRIEEPPGTFYLDGCILYYIFRNEWAEEDQSNWDGHCEETSQWPSQLMMSYHVKNANDVKQ